LLDKVFPGAVQRVCSGEFFLYNKLVGEVDYGVGWIMNLEVMGIYVLRYYHFFPYEP